MDWGFLAFGAGIAAIYVKLHNLDSRLTGFQRDTYRRSIIRFYKDLLNNPDKIVTLEEYKSVFSDIDKYFALKGNSYIEDVAKPYIYESYYKHFGR